MLTNADIERFWPRVEKRGSEECWPWKAGVTGSGYGGFTVNLNGRPTVMGAHQVALLAEGRDRPPGAYVLHSCDNRLCCNPAHLRYGSQRDNIHDIHARGRTNWNPRKGEDNQNSVLTLSQVRMIFALQQIQCSTREIADGLKLSVHAVADVCSGKSWRHVHGKPGFPTLEQIKANGKRRNKLSELDKDRIRRLIAEGWTNKDIAAEFGVSTAPISNLRVHGRTWVPKA